MTRPILLCAGGTGGHLFPAEALARVLIGRGAAVELATDARALAYAADFPARAVHALASATPSGGLSGKAAAVLTLTQGLLAAYPLIGRMRPRVVVGFGGYPTVPPVLAAKLRGAPVVLHEQNAVMGRANRFLARGRVAAIASGFATLRGAPAGVPVTHTGNPLRPAVLAAAAGPPAQAGRILVTGGSQGARVMADIAPAAIAALAPEHRARIRVTQQARAEDCARVEAIYAAAGVTADVAPFFADLPARMAAAELVIARAGASTVSELACIGRASILVPYPYALDQDQAQNAAVLACTGGASLVAEVDFTSPWLTHALTQALDNPAELKTAGERAKSAAVTDAAERLADLVLRVAKNSL